jgi:NitT/TauT family transport system permease protein
MKKLWKSKTIPAYFWMALGVLALVTLWQLMSQVYSPIFVPSPGETLRAMLGLFSSPESISTIYHTFYRVLLAQVFLIITGITVGILAGFKPWLEQLLKPVKDVLMAIPPVALSLLVIFLFGGGTLQTVMIAVALGFPLLFSATVTAVRSVDRDLLEMFGAFKVAKAVQLWEGFLPAVIYSVLPNILLAAGLTVRLIVLAEIIVGMNIGVGQALSIARVHLATEDIFAWLLLMAAAVLIIEGGLLHLVKRNLLKWQAGR